MKAKPAAYFVIRWTCPECGRKGATPEVRQGGQWSDALRVIERLHCAASAGCPGLIGNFALEFSRARQAAAPPIARPA